MKWRIDDSPSEAAFLPQLESPLAWFAAAPSAPVVSLTAGAVTATVTPVNSALADIVAHETNGVLTYSGALAVLEDAAQSAMTAIEFSGLEVAAELLNVAGGVKASAYVTQIFADVVLGNSANLYWNGGASTATALGDLTPTSNRTQLNYLIRKWFLGTDLPGVAPAPGQNGPATVYWTYNLPLFSSAGPKITDVNQGQVGDCWFLAALGETALKNPTLIAHLITANGNGSYSVEFQVNGHADYVTVNNQFSSYTGGLAQWDGSKMEFANSTTSLWVPLVEKALAELSEQSGVLTGMDYAGGQNQYYELTDGAGEGISLLTGQVTHDYAIAGRGPASLTGLLNAMQNDLAAGHDVLVGTSELAVSGNLVADHMFAVTAVDTASGLVSLYNPWGANGAGAGKPETFTIAVSALVSDNAYFYAGVGPVNVT